MKKQNIIFLLGLLVFGILLACTETPEQIAEKARNSTVRLVSERDGYPIGWGSGFFVERNQIVTNIHVVARADKVAVRLVGTKTEYKIIGVTASDEKNDLVILQTAEKNGKPLTLSASNSIEPGTSIFAVGTPEGGEEGQITDGTFHSIRKSDGRLQLKAMISPGNSGGPVLSWKKAEVIGVAVAGSGETNISYAIPSNILKLLKGRGSDDTVKPLHEWQKIPVVLAYRNFLDAIEVSIDDTQQVKNAIGDLNKIIEDNPHLAAAAFENIARLLLHGLGDHQAAIEYFKKLTKLMDDYSVGYYHLGRAILISADLESTTKAKIPQYKMAAIDNFSKAIELIPFADAYYNRGLVRGTLGQSTTDEQEAQRLYEEAIEDFDEAIELNPDYVEAYYNRGIANRYLGLFIFTLGQSKDEQKEKLSLYEAAVRELDKAITDQRDAIEMGYADTDQGEAIKKEYAGTYYSRGSTQLMLADIYKSEGNKEEAQRLYEAAVIDFKEIIRLDRNLKTYVQQMLKQAEESLEQLKK